MVFRYCGLALAETVQLPGNGLALGWPQNHNTETPKHRNTFTFTCYSVVLKDLGTRKE